VWAIVSHDFESRGFDWAIQVMTRNPQARGASLPPEEVPLKCAAGGPVRCYKVYADGRTTVVEQRN
jgi:hypothetical protein